MRVWGGALCCLTPPWVDVKPRGREAASARPRWQRAGLGAHLEDQLPAAFQVMTRHQDGQLRGPGHCRRKCDFSPLLQLFVVQRKVGGERGEGKQVYPGAQILEKGPTQQACMSGKPSVQPIDLRRKALNISVKWHRSIHTLLLSASRIYGRRQLELPSTAVFFEDFSFLFPFFFPPFS